MIDLDKCCCIKMREALEEVGPIPINLDRGDWPSGIECINHYDLKLDFETDEEFWLLKPYTIINNACPFCGKNISFRRRRKRDPKYSKGLCNGFLSWFDRNNSPYMVGMVEYNHRNNQFYLHNRKGLGEGYIPINYCTLCGEPLSEMVSKYGLPDEIKSCLHSDEWWKKRGL